MSFAKEMNILALDARLRHKAEAKTKAQKIFDDYKASIEHFAKLGQMSTAISIPYEYKGEERNAIAIALREVLIENGFKVANIADDRCHISWAEVNETI